MHQFDIEPTPDTLSYYIVYMSHQISPRSVKSYLSGLVQQLEPDFPNIQDVRGSHLVTRAMKGCLKMLAKPIKRKDPLLIEDLRYLENKFRNTNDHDNLLFLSLLVTGFQGLLHLGKLTFPDDPSLREWRKISRWASLQVQSSQYLFQLTAHKADKFFEGYKIIIRTFESSCSPFDPFPSFSRYIASQDHLFPASSPLWLTSKGSVPTRSFFMSRFRIFFSKSYGGASMRAGGATHLAKIGTPSSIIHGLGRWFSQAWEVYIHMHPSNLRGFLHKK